MFSAILLVAQAITIQTVDGLLRPLPGVEITVYCGEKSHQLLSDATGRAHGEINSRDCTSAHLAKPGYGSFSTGLRRRYVLNRNLTARDAERLIQTGTTESVRELLAGEAPNLPDAVFHAEHGLRPILRKLLKDPHVAEAARYLLAVIADPQDVELIASLPPPPEGPVEVGDWRYATATALIDPVGPAGRRFLDLCARDEFKEEWVVNGAAQSRKLQRVPHSHANLETAAKLVAQQIDSKTWDTNEAPRYNKAGDKALIDLIFRTPGEKWTYTATFHKTGRTWTLRNVLLTMQALIALPPPPPRP